MRETAWTPQPKQALALECPADELLFGGAAGGGKTDFLLADFLDGVKFGASHRGILFRRSYPELEEVITRSKELYSRIGGNYSVQKAVWSFPGGATLKLRYIESDSDVLNYQGHQYSWIGWDEIGNAATDYAYRYMLSRLRSAAGVPCRTRATANPGGPGHVWVKQRFIDGHPSGHIFKDEESGMTRCFIKSYLSDNEVLLKADPGYVNRLNMLPEHLRRALRDGDWDVFAGQIFEEFRQDTHVVKPFTLGPDWFRFAVMDWGYAKPYAILFFAVDNDGRMVEYREMYGSAGEPNVGLKRGAGQVAMAAWNHAMLDGVTIMVADPACWSKQDDAPSIAEQFEAVGWRMEKADNDRLNGLMRVHELMQFNGSDGKPYLMFFNTCYDTIRTLPTLVCDPTRPEDIDTRQEDHAYDAVRYGVMSRFSKFPREYLGHKSRRSGKKSDFNPLDHGLRGVL